MECVKILDSLGELKNISSEFLVIIPFSVIKDLISSDKLKRDKAILKKLKELADTKIKFWFNLTDNDIIVQYIENELKRINNNIKLLKEREISISLIESFQKSGIIPVICV